MLLLATLTACGSVMPNLYCRYGIAAKRYYPNLQLFIVGSVACGKGIANLALVPSIENGYFSRLLTLIVNDVQPFSERYVQPAESSQSVIATAAEQLYHLYQGIKNCMRQLILLILLRPIVSIVSKVSCNFFIFRPLLKQTL